MKRNRYLSFFFAGLIGASVLQTATSLGVGLLHCRGGHTQPIFIIEIHPDDHIEAIFDRTDGGYTRRAAHFTSVKVEVMPREFPFPGDDQPYTRYSATDEKGNTFQATLSESSVSGHFKAKVENTEFHGAVRCQTQMPRPIYYYH